MDYTELSDQFDLLFNNITSNQAPGLDEYEKSVILTKGQDETIKNYFNPKGNKYGEGFDGNQKRQIDFSSITSIGSISGTDMMDALYDVHSNSRSAKLPDDVWMIVNERTEVTREGKTVSLTTKPISFEEYDRLMSKPFKRPLKYQAWRLINNDGSNKCDLIVAPKDVITEYVIRYVRRPRPVIVGELDDRTINGYIFGDPADSTANVKYAKGCELDPILHEEILQRAVELAKIAWTQTGQDNTQAVLQAGQRSE